MNSKKIALFFGSFNPIHVGHLAIASQVVNENYAEECWLVVSPQNPFKEKKTLLDDHHRLRMVEEAVEDNPKLKACNVEFYLPKPSYTIDTLINLKEKYPTIEFSIIMGEDNIKSFHKWKNYEVILRDYTILVYPRVNVEEHLEIPQELIENSNVKFLKDMPVMNISASYIRKVLQEGKSAKYLITDPVLSYLEKMNFYKD